MVDPVCLDVPVDAQPVDPDRALHRALVDGSNPHGPLIGEELVDAANGKH
jgi:hypothetical protein